MGLVLLGVPLAVTVFFGALFPDRGRVRVRAVLASITAGAVTFGVLGAFLAVPVAASTARTVDDVRGRRPEAGPGSEQPDGSG